MSHKTLVFFWPFQPLINVSIILSSMVLAWWLLCGHRPLSVSLKTLCWTLLVPVPGTTFPTSYIRKDSRSSFKNQQRYSGHRSLMALRYPSWHSWWRNCLPTQEMWKMQVQSLGREDPLEKEMETHSSILAWEISWTEVPGRLSQSMGSQRVRITEHAHTHISKEQGGTPAL